MKRALPFPPAALRRLLNGLLVAALLVGFFQPIQASAALAPDEQAETLLEHMTPEERIGQLFLVTFQDSNIQADNPIYDLIKNRHIGGVILLSANNNFPNNSDPARQAFDLNQQLQQIAWDASRQMQTKPNSTEQFRPQYVPLFIGVSQEGDGYANDQILSGLTPLPNAMSIGATWNPDLAAQVGNVAGKELSALGINLLFGPSLDVIEAPQGDSAGSLGTRAFGSDPYWVAEMGRAYIRGVRQGSQGRLAIAAKHFPGHGSSDRLPEDEVATVRKSLEQLKSFDLAPFFAVTGSAAAPEEAVDGLLTSHIRYQGLQGNIRATTRPISFDPQALALLMGLPALDAWRQNGGLIISDDLGSQAVRRFYDLTSQTFDARRVALNAFLAGNDLLYFADFSSVDTPDSYTAALRTLDFFTQKYREDSAFAQRVDASVLRILTLKFRLYASFTQNSVRTSSDALADLGQSGKVTFEVARQAATLISPTQNELDNTIPDPPDQNDRIVFISDARAAQPCSQCAPSALLEARALQDAVVRLYGPQSGGQTTLSNLSSYTLADLDDMLAGAQPAANLEADLTRANWIVFNMLAPGSDNRSFQILGRFLTERPGLFQQKRLIVFAFCAPYYMDATNISKLTAYYGLYSKTPQFVDVAAYLLFRELRPEGALPVSVSGIGYDLNQALFPDPARAIPLELDIPVAAAAVDATTATPEPTLAPEYRLGDVIPLRTGVILDYNGNPVPDGTPVNFIFTLGSNTIRQVETTRKGQARTTFAVTAPGALLISAESENARSAALRFDIPSPTGEQATVTPTETPTATPEPSSTATLPTLVLSTPAPPTPPNLEISDWFFVVLVALVAAWLIYRLAALMNQVRWGMRAAFLSFIGGLSVYSYLAMRLAAAENKNAAVTLWPLFLVTVTGAALGALLTLGWAILDRMQRKRSLPEEKELTPSKTPPPTPPPTA